jgi:signal transduction histidine kinase
MTISYAGLVKSWRVELALAVGLLAITVVGVASELHYAPFPVPGPLPAYTITVLACAVLPLRRRYPWLVALAVVTLGFAYHIMGYPGLAVALPAFVAVYSLAAYGDGWPRLAGCALTVAAIWAVPVVGPNALPWYSFAITGPALGLATFAILGAAARQRRLAAEDRLRAAEQAAEAELSQRLAEQRLHIARELHDVLAHTVAVIAVQAGVALDTLTSDPDAAREALLLVRAAARQAGPELRAAVGPLRTSTVPAPRLDGLPALVEPLRAAGIAVTCDLEPGPGELPHPVELTAYRIVQESLTNVVRHAGAGTVHIGVIQDGPELRVEVRDDGRHPAAPNPAGLGLEGMRERAALLGGSCDAGPLPGGGFRVLARLPVRP